MTQQSPDTASGASTPTTEDPIQTPGENDLVRTVVTIEVLSVGPVGDLEPEELAHAIVQGDCSGKVDYGPPQILTKREMALALIGQNSDPGFLLGEDEWMYGLQPGDEVNWTDPDNQDPDSDCSRIVTIRNIEFPTDEVFRIETAQGDVIEGYVSELS